MRKWTPIVVLIALAGVLVLGCSQEQAETEAPPAVEEAVETSHMAEGHMAGGETAMLSDPVCGMNVAEDNEFAIDQDGTTYGFCSEGCRDAFVAEPEKFIAQ